MTTLLLVLVPALLLVCFDKPRLGIFITISVGFLADPIRKVIPGEPVFLVALVAIYAGVTLVGAMRVGLVPSPARLLARAGSLRRPTTLFLLLVGFSSSVALLRTGSPVIAGIGLIAYMAPVPAILLGYGIGSSERSAVAMLRFYAAFTAVFAFGILMSALGFDSPLLWSVGEEMVVYAEQTGEAVRLLCGFFRASEVAAWHCATACCLLVVIAAAYRRRPREFWIAAAASGYFMVAIVFTGRRKAFASIVLFALVFGVFLLRFRRGTKTLASLALVAAVLTGVFGETSIFPERFETRYQVYLEREQTTTPTSALERLELMTVGSLGYVLNANGFLGSGAGTGSQGAQHFGGGIEIVGGAVEGGLGKILAELGVPGVLVLLWIAIELARRLFRGIRSIGTGDPARATLALGLSALLVTNAIEFVTAHQVYGDPFVLLMLGWLLGILIVLVRPARGQRRLRAPAPPAAPASTVRVANVRPIEGIEGWSA
ncbi:MAG: O-antigen ligase family protein [Thermoanaerobaculia bacterium]